MEMTWGQGSYLGLEVKLRNRGVYFKSDSSSIMVGVDSVGP